MQIFPCLSSIKRILIWRQVSGSCPVPRKARLVLGMPQRDLFSLGPGRRVPDLIDISINWF